MLDRLSRAFGFTEKLRFAGDDRTVNHAEMEVAGSSIMLDDPGDDYRARRTAAAGRRRSRCTSTTSTRTTRGEGAGAEIRQELATCPTSTAASTPTTPRATSACSRRTCATCRRGLGRHRGRLGPRRHELDQVPERVADEEPLPAADGRAASISPPSASRARRLESSTSSAKWCSALSSARTAITCSSSSPRGRGRRRGLVRSRTARAARARRRRSPGELDGSGATVIPTCWSLMLEPLVHAPSAGVRTWRMFCQAGACGSRSKRESASGSPVRARISAEWIQKPTNASTFAFGFSAAAARRAGRYCACWSTTIWSETLHHSWSGTHVAAIARACVIGLRAA